MGGRGCFQLFCSALFPREIKKNSLDTLHICIGQVNLVDDRNDLQIIPKSQVEV
jgi:hypothetical protein